MWKFGEWLIIHVTYCNTHLVSVLQIITKIKNPANVLGCLFRLSQNYVTPVIQKFLVRRRILLVFFFIVPATTDLLYFTKCSTQVLIFYTNNLK
jgi:hypothetical protein